MSCLRGWVCLVWEDGHVLCGRMGVSCVRGWVFSNVFLTLCQHLMRHALESPSSRRTWKTFFDYIFVDAQKPKFFQEGTTLREVDEATGSLKLGHIQPHKGLEKSKVYAGGMSVVREGVIVMDGVWSKSDRVS